MTNIIKMNKPKNKPFRPTRMAMQGQPGLPEKSSEKVILPQECKGPLMVAIPTGKPSIYTATVKSLFSSQQFLTQFNQVSFYSHAGSLIHVARQETLDTALRAGVRWLWFIDDDMTFPAHTPVTLAKNCYDNGFVMCSALAIKRVPPFSPTVGMRLDDEGEPILTPEDVPSSGVHEVMHTGLACTIIDLDLLRQEKINENKKLFYMQVNEMNTKMLGEDLAFCKILKSHNLKVGLNADIWTGHVGVHEFKPEMWFSPGGWRDKFIEHKNKANGINK